MCIRDRSTERAKWLLTLLDIYEFKTRYPHELSGGQSQRVALARALAPGNSLVLLDEPFCSLDVEVRSRLRSELSSVLKSCSASALLVTHDPHEALAICDRVAVMRSGEIQQYSTPPEMVSSPSNDFVGQFVLQRNILPIQYINQSYSVDGALGIGDAIQLIGFAAKTDPAPGIKGNNDSYAYVLEANRNKQSFTNQIRYSEVGKNFNPEMGFVKRLGYRKVLFRILNRTRPKDFFGILELRPHITYWGYWKLEDGFQAVSYTHLTLPTKA